MEHLPETEKHKHKSINPLQDFLGAAQDHTSAIEAPPSTPLTPSSPAVAQPGLTMEEYFTKPKKEEEYDGECEKKEITAASNSPLVCVQLLGRPQRSTQESRS